MPSEIRLTMIWSTNCALVAIPAVVLAVAFGLYPRRRLVRFQAPARPPE